MNDERDKLLGDSRVVHSRPIPMNVIGLSDDEDDTDEELQVVNRHSQASESSSESSSSSSYETYRQEDDYFLQQTSEYFACTDIPREQKNFVEIGRTIVVTKVSVEDFSDTDISEEFLGSQRIYSYTNRENDSSAVDDMEVFFQEMLQTFPQIKNFGKSYKLVDFVSTTIDVVEIMRMSFKGVAACEEDQVAKMCCRKEKIHRLIASAPRLLLDSKNDLDIIKQTAEFAENTTKYDKVDGFGKRSIDIAVAIYRDDVESLKLVLKKEESTGDVVYRRILEAVETSSLKCLDYLCHIYDELTGSSPTEQRVPESDTQLCHRRFGLHWPLSDLPKESPLHLIASRSSAGTAMKIVGKYTRFMEQYLDEPNSQMSTPLLISVKKDNVDVAKQLIKNPGKKPDFERKNCYGESPIYFAALKGQTELIKEMLQEYSNSSGEERLKSLGSGRNLYGKDHSILFPASQSKNPDILDVLMDTQEGDVLLEIEKDHESDWGLFVCNVFASGCERLVKKVLQLEGAKSIGECKDSEEATPLMRAAEANKLEVVVMIFGTERGRETISALDKHGKSVFHYAVKCPDVLEYLLLEYTTLSESMAAVNREAEDGSTPLQLAARGGFTESFKMLLKYKRSEADLFSRPFAGYTNIDILKLALEDLESEKPEALSDFLRGNKEYQPLLQAAALGDIDMMQFLIEKGTDEKQRGFDDSTALHCAVLAGKYQAVEFLIEKFPDMIDCTNDCGETAACCATEIGNVEILRFLLDKGAKLTSDKTTRVNILDSAFGYFKKAEETIKEVIKFCEEGNSPRRLKKLLEDSHFGPDRLMSKMVKDIPNVAMEVFRQCKCEETRLRNRSYAELAEETKVTYHFFPFNRKENDGKLEAIESMVKFRREECLGHPVVVKFLNKKLNSLRVNLWLYNILLYTIFLVSLSTYTGLQTKGSYSLKSPGLLLLSIVIIITCIANIVKEILQAAVTRMDYFYHLDNYIEWVTYICAIIYVIPGDEKKCFQIRAGAIAVFLAWINFLYFLKRFSFLGIYVIMAAKVFASVCKVLPMVFFFISAFAMAFSLLMSDDSGFASIPTSFLTTFVMMTGEVNFRDTFLGYSTSHFHVLQRLFLILFLTLVTIAVMNLLTGLAVGDTNEVMQRSKQERRLYKAKIVLALERNLHKFPQLSSTFKDVAVEDKSGKQPWLTSLWQLWDDDEFEDEDENIELKDVDERLKEMSKDNKTQSEEMGKQLTSIKNDIVTEMAKADETRTQTLQEQLDGLSQRGDVIAENFMEKLNNLENKEAKVAEIEEQLAHLSEMFDEREKKIKKQLSKIEIMLEMVESNVASILQHSG